MRGNPLTCGLRLFLGSSMQYKVYGHVVFNFGAIDRSTEQRMASLLTAIFRAFLLLKEPHFDGAFVI